ncbi:hypothetical protein [Hydrogenoanaerobacterium sp.]|uniref:hypothetical protein n=1 Tax=Hydrogenoanaerobacterium sp. TaxID=2953763 RepID=UPI00289FB3E5|nr:hypothetical protein [Hydrogenoanaerobacterium sp.]
MNQGQKQFSDYILKRVKENKIEEARALLAENFRKQTEGSFTHDDIAQFASKIIALLKPDKIEEVQAVIEQFSEHFSH